MLWGSIKAQHFFFKRKNEEHVEGIDDENNEIKHQKTSTSEPVNEANQNIQQEHDIPENLININEVGVSSLERDTPKRLGMWNIRLIQRSK
ncbi:hypothetical protein Hanom_Chr04g00279751 [Helianthus anomalus]